MANKGAPSGVQKQHAPPPQKNPARRQGTGGARPNPVAPPPKGAAPPQQALVAPPPPAPPAPLVQILDERYKDMEKKVAVATVAPPSEDLNPYSHFPEPAENNKCLGDLKQNLQKRGLDLLVRHGKPEDILPAIAKAVSAHTVYAHKETCSEELLVERLVRRGLEQVAVPQGQGGASGRSNKPLSPKLQLVWGATMYHIDDLPFPVSDLPDVYTQFRKAVESKSSVRSCGKLPPSLGPAPGSGLDEIGGWGSIPTLESLGLSVTKAGSVNLTRVWVWAALHHVTVVRVMWRARAPREE
ncbi:unnamed protein product [Triticum turgidum subsp. durum]|uniref:Photolyase/cryptochrome alpha/beta domain-containing protein n=1 Tax=Triticum turgidum subsp. durum TaxID=4567 RepID=A0A9R0ZMH2_TRITD|nr:unnamed protein product [Triticum turgidum subsp. durum]